MKKIISKPLFYPSLVALMMIFSLSAHNSFWPSNQVLNTDDKMNCLKFQDSRGSNRIIEANKLWHSLFSKLSTNNQKEITTSEYSLFDVKKMFGSPDDVTADGNFVYYLNISHQDCKILVRNNKDTHTISYFFDECN
jgi:hypothetical protein